MHAPQIPAAASAMPRGPATSRDKSQEVPTSHDWETLQFGLDDIFSALRRHLKLLITGPIIAGAISFAAVSFMPKLYTSSAYLRVDEVGSRAADAVMSSAPVLDRIMSAVKIPGDTIEARRRYLNDSRRVAVAANETQRTSKLFRFDVTNADPRTAQAINSLLISAWLDSTKPPPNKRAAIESDIERIEAQTKSISDMVDRLSKEASKLLLENSLQGELATPIITLTTKRDQNLATIVGLKDQLRGVSDDAIFGAPDLPEAPSWPKRGIITVLSAVGVGLLLLIIIMSRAIWSRRRLQREEI